MQLLSRNTASNVQRAEYIRKMFSGKIGMGVQMFDPFITLKLPVVVMNIRIWNIILFTISDMV